jgi:hypothetical protein
MSRPIGTRVSSPVPAATNWPTRNERSPTVPSIGAVIVA